MCGRYVSASPPDELAKYFNVASTAEQVLEPSYNVAPTKDVYVVLETGGVRRLDTYRWGLVPFWAKDAKIGSRMINARAEGLTSSNAYKRAFAKRRCLVPADGFYEWKVVPGQKAKQPMYIERPDGEPFAFAGLWELWRPPDKKDDDDAVLRTCTIITTAANDAMAPVHDRMPAVLPPSAWDQWLDPANDDLDTLGHLLVPAPDSIITMHPVSTAVNNVRQDGPDLVVPVERDEGLEGRLL